MNRTLDVISGVRHRPQIHPAAADELMLIGSVTREIPLQR